MLSQVTIYTIGDPSYIAFALRAISLFISAEGYISAMIGFMIGLIIYGIKSVMTGRFEFGYLAGTLFISIILFSSTIETNVEDYASSSVHHVGDLPLGLALPFGMTTWLGRELTLTVETSFQHPARQGGIVNNIPSTISDVTFTSSGFLSPLRALHAAKGANVLTSPTFNPNGRFSKTFNNYIYDCYKPYMTLEGANSSKVSFNSDVIDSLSVGVTSWPVKSYLQDNVNGDLVSCDFLFNNIKSEISSHSFFQAILHNLESKTAMDPNEYQKNIEWYAGTTALSEQLLRNFAVREIIRVTDIYGDKSSSDAISTIAEVEAISTRQAQDALKGEIFKEKASTLLTFFEGFIIFAFPFVMLLAMIGLYGGTILTAYLLSLVWINLWPLAMLGVDVYTFASLQGTFSESNFSDFTNWQTMDSIYTTSMSYLATSSELAAYIPLLAGFLLTGSYMGLSAISGSSSPSSSSVSTLTPNQPKVRDGKMSDGDFSYSRGGDNVLRRSHNGANDTRLNSFQLGNSVSQRTTKDHTAATAVAQEAQESVNQAFDASVQAQQNSLRSLVNSSLETFANQNGLTVGSGASGGSNTAGVSTASTTIGLGNGNAIADAALAIAEFSSPSNNQIVEKYTPDDLKNTRIDQMTPDQLSRYQDSLKKGGAVGRRLAKALGTVSGLIQAGASVTDNVVDSIASAVQKNTQWSETDSKAFAKQILAQTQKSASFINSYSEKHAAASSDINKLSETVQLGLSNSNDLARTISSSFSTDFSHYAQSPGALDVIKAAYNKAFNAKEGEFDQQYNKLAADKGGTYALSHLSYMTANKLLESKTFADTESGMPSSSSTLTLESFMSDLGMDAAWTGGHLDELQKSYNNADKAITDLENLATKHHIDNNTTKLEEKLRSGNTGLLGKEELEKEIQAHAQNGLPKAVKTGETPSLLGNKSEDKYKKAEDTVINATKNAEALNVEGGEAAVTKAHLDYTSQVNSEGSTQLLQSLKDQYNSTEMFSGVLSLLSSDRSADSLGFRGALAEKGIHVDQDALEGVDLLLNGNTKFEAISPADQMKVEQGSQLLDKFSSVLNQSPDQLNDLSTKQRSLLSTLQSNQKAYKSSKKTYSDGSDENKAYVDLAEEMAQRNNNFKSDFDLADTQVQSLLNPEKSLLDEFTQARRGNSDTDVTSFVDSFISDNNHQGSSLSLSAEEGRAEAVGSYLAYTNQNSDYSKQDYSRAYGLMNDISQGFSPDHLAYDDLKLVSQLDDSIQNLEQENMRVGGYTDSHAKKINSELQEETQRIRDTYKDHETFNSVAADPSDTRTLNEQKADAIIDSLDSETRQRLSSSDSSDGNSPLQRMRTHLVNTLNSVSAGETVIRDMEQLFPNADQVSAGRSFNNPNLMPYDDKEFKKEAYDKGISWRDMARFGEALPTISRLMKEDYNNAYLGASSYASRDSYSNYNGDILEIFNPEREIGPLRAMHISDPAQFSTNLKNMEPSQLRDLLHDTRRYRNMDEGYGPLKNAINRELNDRSKSS